MRKILTTILATAVLTTSAYAADPTARINKAIRNYDTYVDMRECQMSIEDIANFMAVYYGQNMSASFIDKNLMVYDEDDNGLYDAIELKYKYSKEENTAITKFITNKENELVDRVKGMSQREQAKYIYKYIVHNYTYDEALNGDLYYMYKNNKGICCSFSLAYYRLMSRLNIPCQMVLNSDHTHQWNKIFIDGKWQEVDITEGIRLYNTGFPKAEMRAFSR